ncbi:DUF4815 domain-containing protein [Marine Group I thaumarchaeote]|uniref:DUF4815 domain-containing protein n=1 Tax=Marine Group I thaumarchaeote TaxID=2511932 RepID=A0A7K4MPW1_9ARCH|nr:DUF4815 domain-containing protein [Marine Group I thaumarchaeote]
MALTTDFNVDPYYDDFDQTKNFHKVLFRPGYAVQAREVSQLQTILQKQIERHGQHMFQEGSVVLGCEVNYDNEVRSLKLETQFSGEDITITDYANVVVTGATSNARARVVATIASTTTDQPTLMFHYMNNNAFNNGETITVLGTATQANTVSSSGASGIETAEANGSVVSINSGVFYVGGYFTFKDSESLVLEKYSSTPSYRVGIQITETIVDSDADSSLLDPAQGAYNYAAQGANRYKIALALSAKTYTATDPVEAAADQNFYQLLKLRSGIKEEETKYPVYSEIEKTLARRTYDESGDYTVRPFNLQIADHQGLAGETGNSGSGETSTLTGVGTDFVTDLTSGDVIYLSGNTANTAIIDSIANTTVALLTGAANTFTSGQTIHFESKFSAGLEPGKAYVKGYEYESIDTKYVNIEKGRDTSNVTNHGLRTAFGNKLHVKNANGFFDISRHHLVDLHCSNVAIQNTTGSTSTSDGTDDLTSTYGTQFTKYNSQTKVGTARIRDMDWYSASGNTSNVSHSHSDHIVYLYDVRTSNSVSGNVADANLSSTIIQIGNSTTNTVSNTADVYIGATIKVTTPNLDRILQENLDTIALESGDAAGVADDTVGSGILVNEDQSGVSNTVDSRTIVDYTLSGGNAFVVIDDNLQSRTYHVTNSTATIIGTTYAITYQIKDVDSIAVTNSTARFADADVDELSKYNSISSANTILKETELNSLIFPLPNQPVANTFNFDYTYKKTSAELQSASNGLVTVALSGTDTFAQTGDALASSVAEENFVVVVKDNNDDTGALGTSNGQYLSFSNTDGYSRRAVVTAQQALLYCNTTNGVINVSVTYTAQKIALAPRTKSLVPGRGNTSYALTSNNLNTQLANGQYHNAAPSRTPGERTSLKTVDVFNIVKIVDSGALTANVTNAMMTQTANLVTNSYVLDTGQTDNFYGHSSIYLKPGQPAPKGQICVVFDRFSHETTPGYFSVNSYPTTSGVTFNQQNTTVNTIFTYSNVPEYTSPVTGEKIRLTDVVDYRPFVQQDTNDGTTAVNFYIANNTDAIANSGILLPDSDTTTELDFYYYLPRIDKLILTRDRQFEVIKGKSTEDPVAPPDDDDSMTLYTLSVPAYTFALTDIETRYIDNKRFTMRDIGKLEKRIERMEYFIALSILEKETAARNITSSGSRDSLFNTRGERFKNGILVDTFAGHSIGDASLDDYSVAVNFKDRVLRAPFYYDNFGFTYKAASSNNVTQTGDLLTLPFTSNTFIDQPLTSNTAQINPFNIVNFIGGMNLSPPSDTWFDDTSRAEVTVNLEGHHDNYVLSSNTTRMGFGSQWNDWSTNWTGTQVNPEPNTAVSNSGSLTTGTRGTKSTAQSKTKFGLKSDNPVETIVKTVGNKIVDMSVVPFVRAQTVSFASKGMKPLTNVYTYIGNTHMSANTEPAKKLVLSSANAAFQEGETIEDSANNRGIIRIASNTVSNVATLYITDINGNSSATAAAKISSQNNRITNSSIGFLAANIVTGVTSGANGTIGSIVANSRNILSSDVSQMQTTEIGEIAGDIQIPAGTFRVGDRIIRLTDSATNNVAATTTVVEIAFKVKGLYQNRERLIISTREPIIRRESLTSEEIVTDTTSRQTDKTNWINPMAQSFHVDPNNFPMGIFLKDVTLWFYAKDSYLPVTVQLRPIVNGFPSSSIILPFSEKTLNPDVIQTSDTANAFSSNTTTHTTFTFDSPVYLTPDEYALVVVSNSPEYKLYTGEHGISATGTSRTITKQSFVGSFFRPQNAGVWEAKKEEFLMFRANRCEFSGTGGVNNYVHFISHANGAVGNTANVNYETFKVTSSVINFSNTSADFTYNGTSDGSTFLGYTAFSLDQNIKLAASRTLKAKTNGQFTINCTMSTSNSHVSPVIDLDRLSLIAVENDVDNAILSANDITVTTVGGGYSNTVNGSYTASLSSPDTGSNTATVNVHVEVTLNLTSNSTSLASGNSDYTTDDDNPSKFVIGEGIMITGSGTQSANDAYGLVASQTYKNDNTSANVASVTIKTSANNKGHFANGCVVVANSLAQDSDHTNSGKSAEGSHSNTTFISNKAVGSVSNVIPVSAGSGYLTTPTITISAPSHPSTDTQAVANVVGEDSTSGGNINTRYISRRVTLEDEFDAGDIKVILNAYKPLGTGIHLYYKAKHKDDPQDFDEKSYVLMSQETVSSRYSSSEEDIKEFVFKTSYDEITYTSDNVLYENFKSFAVKVCLTSNNAALIPKVKDMRAIALDT